MWFKSLNKPRKTLGEIAILNAKRIKEKNKRENEEDVLRSFTHVLEQIEQQIVKERKGHVRIKSIEIHMFEDNEELFSEFLDFLEKQDLVVDEGNRTTWIKPKLSVDDKKT